MTFTPKHQINSEIEVRIGSEDRDVRGTVIGITAVFPIFMYIVSLDNPIEGDFGPQTGLHVPENLLISKPDLDQIEDQFDVGSYVCIVSDDDDEWEAIDVSISVGSNDGLHWFVISEDELEGIQPVVFTPFTSQEEATDFAKNYLEENHEAAPGENAEEYTARVSGNG